MPTLLVLDTCAMRDTGFWKWLKRYNGRKVLPVVAYTELSVYFVGKRGKTQDEVDSLLHSLGIEIDWFRHDKARTAVRISVNMGDFHENWRDYMIASHAFTAPWTVVTNNVDDFAFLMPRVKTPYEIQNSS